MYINVVCFFIYNNIFTEKIIVHVNYIIPNKFLIIYNYMQFTAKNIITITIFIIKCSRIPKLSIPCRLEILPRTNIYFTIPRSTIRFSI